MPIVDIWIQTFEDVDEYLNKYMEQYFNDEDVLGSLKKLGGTLSIEHVEGFLSLDFDFAMNLQRGDVIDPGCFSIKNENFCRTDVLERFCFSKDEMADDLREFLINTELTFVVYKKQFKSKDHLAIDFICCHVDYDTAVINKMYRGKPVDLP